MPRSQAFRFRGGYPLNSFVTSAGEEELGLVNGAKLNSDIAIPVARSLVALIVAAYDAETFIVWDLTEDAPGWCQCWRTATFTYSSDGQPAGPTRSKTTPPATPAS